MLSGGSFASWSLTWAASTVRVQVSPFARAMSGSSVKVDGPPLKVVETLPLRLHSSVNQEEVTLTGSLKVTDRLALIGKSAAPSSGKVSTTSGARSTLRGVSEKLSTARPSSDELILKSVQRIQKEAPLGMLKPVIDTLKEDWFPGSLPFKAPAAVAARFGLLKSRLS